jgi:hypothetical protein
MVYHEEQMSSVSSFKAVGEPGVDDGDVPMWVLRLER